MHSQHVCLGRRAGDLLIHNFSLLATKANYRHLFNVHTTTHLWAASSEGPYSPMEQPTQVMGKHLFGGAPVPVHPWCVLRNV